MEGDGGEATEGMSTAPTSPASFSLRKEVGSHSPTNQDAELHLSRGASPDRLVLSFGESTVPKGKNRLSTPKSLVTKERNDDLAPLPRLKEPPIINFPHAAVRCSLSPLHVCSCLRDLRPTSVKGRSLRGLSCMRSPIFRHHFLTLYGIFSTPDGFMGDRRFCS